MHEVLFAADGIICLHKTTSTPDIHISQVCKEENKHKINKQQCRIWKVAQSIKNFSCEILYTLVLTSLIFHSSPYKTLVNPCLAHLSTEGNCYEARTKLAHIHRGSVFHQYILRQKLLSGEVKFWNCLPKQIARTKSVLIKVEDKWFLGVLDLSQRPWITRTFSFHL